MGGTLGSCMASPCHIRLGQAALRQSRSAVRPGKHSGPSFLLLFLQGCEVLAATYNQAAQLWKVGEAQSKVSPDCEAVWGKG